jgi:hypothetical protein
MSVLLSQLAISYHNESDKVPVHESHLQGGQEGGPEALVGQGDSGHHQKAPGD